MVLTKIGILYVGWGCPSTGLIHKSSIRSNFMNFFGPDLVKCKVTRPDLGSWCSWGEIVVKRINLLWSNNKGVHCSMDKPNPTHVKKLVLISSSQLKGLARKLCHLGRHIGWVSVRVQPWCKALGLDLMKPNNHIWTKLLEIGQVLNPALS